MTIYDLRKKTGLSRTKFSKLLHIPYKTVEKWETYPGRCKDYIVRGLYFELLYKGIITKDSKMHEENEYVNSNLEEVK